jgi:hypothetical protein
MTNFQKTGVSRVRLAAVSVVLLSAIAGTLVVATGCGKTSNATAAPLEVQVAEVKQRDVPVYKEWIDTQLNALDADRDLFQAQIDLARIRLDQVLTIVQLYKLGGGWQ